MKFTVITAVYNGEDTLERAMRSVLEQKRGDFEMEYIIVDGGSTDRTAEIIKQYGPDSRSGSRNRIAVCTTP